MTLDRSGRAEIISIGDELLIGQVVNTNASWMAEQLSLAGIVLNRISTIRDKESDIVQAIDEALQRAQVVLITGGLGPTSDDITKPALCKYFNTDLIFNQEAFNQASELFARRGYAMTERNREQAMLPAICEPIKNNQGTAPGMWFEKEGAFVVSMPGVPFEMKTMFVTEVIPKLKRCIWTQNLVHKTLMTTGVGESFLADRILNWEKELPDAFKLAYLPQPGLVRLRLSGQGIDSLFLDIELKRLTNELAGLLNEYVFGFDDDQLESVVGKLLLTGKKTLAIAESCTGGALSAMITSVPGSSAYFKGSVVAYSNEIKHYILGVDNQLILQHGAVSREVVEAMAKGARDAFAVDYALATSGIAGPDGGTQEKPVGTVWISLASATETLSVCHTFGEHRERNIRRSTLAALNMLRLEILKKSV